MKEQSKIRINFSHISSLFHYLAFTNYQRLAGSMLENLHLYI